MRSMEPTSCRLGYVPAFPTPPEPFVVAKLRSPSRYAIVETVGDDQRILCLVDDKGEAARLAFELPRARCHGHGLPYTVA